MNSDFSIRKVKNFSALKGHIKEHDRALQAQIQYKRNYIVRSGSSYGGSGFSLEKSNDRSKDVGSGFRTTFKQHNDAIRI